MNRRFAIIVAFILCLAAISALCIVIYIRQQSNGPIDPRKIWMDNVRQALDAYRIRHGTFPSNEEGLRALETKLIMKETPRDAWGNEFIYERHDKDSYTLKSLGADGKPGGSGNDEDMVLEGTAPRSIHLGEEVRSDDEKEYKALSEVLSQPDLGQRILSNGELVFNVRFGNVFLVRTDSPAKSLKMGTSRGTLYRQEFEIEEVLNGELTSEKIDAKYYMAPDKAPPEKKTYIIVVSSRLEDFNVIAFIETRREALSKIRELRDGKWRVERDKDARVKGAAQNRMIRYGKAVGGQRIYIKVVGISVDGSMSKKAISSVMQSHEDQIRYCYRKELSNDPGISGTVEIECTVSTKGFVTHSKVKGSTLENEEIGKCIAGKIRSLKFPENPRGTSEISIKYSLLKDWKKRQ